MSIDHTSSKRKARPLWQTVLATLARNRFMATTQELAEFVQGWALNVAQIEPDFETRIEIRARTEAFQADATDRDK